MKWYFASRVRHQNKIIEITEFLKHKGQDVLSNWVYESALKPYHENIDKVQKLATEVTASLLATDIFVLVSDPEGTDMFIELGVCLAKSTTSPRDIKIYIIGEYSKRSLMQLHPSITHLKTLREVFEREGIDSSDFIIPSLD